MTDIKIKSGYEINRLPKGIIRNAYLKRKLPLRTVCRANWEYLDSRYYLLFDVKGFYKNRRLREDRRKEPLYCYEMEFRPKIRAINSRLRNPLTTTTP